MLGHDKKTTRGWGRLSIDKPFTKLGHNHNLTVGGSRSYGDVCELDSGNVINTLSHDRLLKWDKASATLTAQSGLTIGALCRFSVTKGFFPAVVPGTQFATLGGCVANDVHGKNHHKVGSFGCHVQSLILIREGSRIHCAADNNSELFYATIGGLGLTGEIDEITITLMPISSEWLSVSHHKFNSLEEYFQLEEWFGEKAAYSVSWLNCAKNMINKSHQAISGIYSIADHMKKTPKGKKTPVIYNWRFPFYPPISIVRPYTTSAFNALYSRLPRSQHPTPIHYRSFLFPLDGILNWNKIYGAKGFFQFQCVFPNNQAKEGLYAMIKQVKLSGNISPLAVVKQLGRISSGGLLSFPRPGYTLALDFPNCGEKTLNFMHKLEDIANSFDGAIYPAKDACMSSFSFTKHYPQYQELERLREPKRLSDFWIRMQN